MVERAVLGGLLLPIVGAYLLIQTNYYLRFKAHHVGPQQYSVFLIAFGVLLYFCSATILAATLPQACVQTNAVEAREACLAAIPAWAARLIEISPDVFYTSAFLAPFLAVPLGIVSNVVLLVLQSDDKALELTVGNSMRKRMRVAAIARFIEQCDEPLLQTLYRATFLQKPVSVTLKSGKVYIGVPVVSLNPTARHAFVKLIPIASGYRKDDDRQLILNVRYSKFADYGKRVRELATNPSQDPTHVLSERTLEVKNLFKSAARSPVVKVDLLDFGVVITWDEVESFTIWNQNIFAHFNFKSSTEEVEVQASS